MNTRLRPGPAALLAALALLLAAPAARAQQGGTARLSVVVVDSAARPVPAVRVVVSGAPAAAYSDSAGRAAVERIPVGSRLVAIERVGFQQERALIRFDRGADIRIQVTLTPAPITLDTLQVLGQRSILSLARNGFYRRRERGLGSFVTREELARTEAFAADLGPAFSQVRGFRVERQPDGGFALLSTRGAGSLSEGVCVPEVFVDGAQADMALLSTLTPRDVAAIEAYAGAAAVPAEYSTSTCGVILVWTRKE